MGFFPNANLEIQRNLGKAEIGPHDSNESSHVAIHVAIFDGGKFEGCRPNLFLEMAVG